MLDLHPYWVSGTLLLRWICTILCWDSNCTIIRLNLFFYNIAVKYAAKDVIFAIIIIGVSCVVAGAMRIAFEESPSSTGQDAG